MFKDLFKPTDNKIILAVVLFLAFFILTLPQVCPDISRLCPGDPAIRGETPPIHGEYFASPKNIPFSCEQACTDSEYNRALTNIVIFKFIVPIIAAYIISCFVLFLFDYVRKK